MHDIDKSTVLMEFTFYCGQIRNKQVNEIVFQKVMCVIWTK